MTFAARYQPITYAGNGTTRHFSTIWPFRNPTHVRVEEITIATGVAVPKIYGVDYSVEGGDTFKGTVIATTAPPATVQWRITRRTPLVIGYETDPTPVPPPESEEHAFVAVGQRSMIVRSLDGGTTWLGVMEPDFDNPILWRDVAGADGRWIVIAFGEAGIWRSTDNAATFTQVPDIDNDALYQSITHVSAGIFVVTIRADPEHFLRTDDYGETWTLIAHGIEMDEFGNPFYLDITCKDGVVFAIRAAGSDSPDARSTDGGLTWTAIASDPDEFSPSAYLSHANGLFISSFAHGLYHSATATDGSWTLVTYTPGEATEGEFGRFVYVGGEYFTFDKAGKGPIKSSALDGTWEDSGAFGTDIDPRDIATDGTNIVYVGQSISEDVNQTGLYSTTGDITVTVRALPGPEYDQGLFFNAVAYA